MEVFQQPAADTRISYSTEIWLSNSKNESHGLAAGQIRSTANNFVDWPHIGAVMLYSGYVEPRDGAVSFLLSSQQEAVACVRCIQKESHCSEG
jgi:hypothetical protein